MNLEFQLQGRTDSEVKRLVFGAEGTSVTVEAVSPRGSRKHATMVRVRPDLLEIPDDDKVSIGERSWGTMCCRI